MQRIAQNVVSRDIEVEGLGIYRTLAKQLEAIFHKEVILLQCLADEYVGIQEDGRLGVTMGEREALGEVPGMPPFDLIAPQPIAAAPAGAGPTATALH